MKITKRKLQRLILEETRQVLNELYVPEIPHLELSTGQTPRGTIQDPPEFGRYIPPSEVGLGPRIRPLTAEDDEAAERSIAQRGVERRRAAAEETEDIMNQRAGFAAAMDYESGVNPHTAMATSRAGRKQSAADVRAGRGTGETKAVRPAHGSRRLGGQTTRRVHRAVLPQDLESGIHGQATGPVMHRTTGTSATRGNWYATEAGLEHRADELAAYNARNTEENRLGRALTPVESASIDAQFQYGARPEGWAPDNEARQRQGLRSVSREEAMAEIAGRPDVYGMPRNMEEAFIRDITKSVLAQLIKR